MEHQEHIQNIRNLAGYSEFHTAMNSAMMYIALGDLNEIDSDRLLASYKKVLQFFRTGDLPSHHTALQEVYTFSVHPERFMALGLPKKEQKRIEYDQKIIKHFIEKFYGFEIMLVSPDEKVIAPLQLKIHSEP